MLCSKKKTPPSQAASHIQSEIYSVDSISKPQASNSASGMYFEFLFRRAHSRKRVERMYWSGFSLNSFTTCSKEVTVGTTGPIGSGFPQFGLPRRFAIVFYLLGVWTHQRRELSPACGLYLTGKSQAIEV